MATPLALASNVGSAASQPSGRVRVWRRSKRATSADGLVVQWWNALSHSAWACWPRSTAARVCAITAGGTSKCFSGSKPRTLLGRSDLVGAEGRAVGLLGALGVGCGPGDDRAQHDEARSVGLGASRLDRGVQRRDVLGVGRVVVGPVDGLHVPAVGLVAGRDVLGEGDVGVALDGDPVGVVDHREVAELLGAGDRGGLATDALLEVAVAADGVDVVVERRLAGCGVRVEHAALAAGGHRHADRVGDALAQRTGGGLDAGGVAVLGVTGGLAAPGAQRLEVLELEAPAAEEELRVERDRAVAAGEHEPVAAGPLRVSGVVPHHLLEEEVRRGREAHRGAGVAVADLLHGIHGEDSRSVDSQLVDLGPVQSSGVAHRLPLQSRRLSLGGLRPVGRRVLRHRRDYSPEDDRLETSNPPSRDTPPVREDPP